VGEGVGGHHGASNAVAGGTATGTPLKKMKLIENNRRNKKL
jgi:hypothetical protein